MRFICDIALARDVYTVLANCFGSRDRLSLKIVTSRSRRHLALLPAAIVLPGPLGPPVGRLGKLEVLKRVYLYSHERKVFESDFDLFLLVWVILRGVRYHRIFFKGRNAEAP
jgi:hypothetical protein